MVQSERSIFMPGDLPMAAAAITAPPPNVKKPPCLQMPEDPVFFGDMSRYKISGSRFDTATCCYPDF